MKNNFTQLHDNCLAKDTRVNAKSNYVNAILANYELYAKYKSLFA